VRDRHRKGDAKRRGTVKILCAKRRHMTVAMDSILPPARGSNA